MSGEVIPDSEVDFIPGSAIEAPKPAPQQVAIGSNQNTIPDSEVVPDSEVTTDEDLYSTPGQQLKTVAEGLGRGLAGPLATAAETKVLGVKPEDIAARQETNPVESGVSEGASLIGGAMIPGVGEYTLGSGLAKVGSGAAKLASKIAPSVATNILANAAVHSAAGMMAYQAGDEVSKWLENQQNSVPSAIANIGIAGLLGGVAGPILSGAMPLLSATKRGALDLSLQSFKDELANTLKIPAAGEIPTVTPTNGKGFLKELAEGIREPDSAKVTEELQGLKSDADQGRSSLFKPEYDQEGNRLETNKDKILRETLPGPENNAIAQNQSDKLVSKVETAIEKIKDPNMSSLLQDELDKYKMSTGIAKEPLDYFYAAEDMKKQLQEWSKFNKTLTPLSEMPLRQASKDLSHQFRTALEDSNVFGRAAGIQKNVNKAISDFIPAEKDFSAFTTKLEGQPVIDPNKIESYLKQVGNNKADIKQNKLKNYVDAVSNFREAVNDAHVKAGMNEPFKTPISINETSRSFGKVPDGVRLVRSLVSKGLGKIVSGGAGALAGRATGIPGAGMLGAYLGEKSIGTAVDSVLPGLIKKLVSQPTNIEAMNSALKFGVEAIKGEEAIDKGIKGLFKTGLEVGAGKELPSEKDTKKLDDRLKTAQSNPESLMNVSKGLTHYMPNHSTEVTKTLVNSVNYLNSQRPEEVQQAPLDTTFKPTAMAKNKWNRTLDIAENPLKVLNHIKSGTLQPNDVATLQNVHPGLYSKLVSKMVNQISEIPKDIRIPFRTKMSMSLFLNQPLDSSLSQTSILAAQPVPQSPPQAQSGPKKPTAASAKAMNTVSQSAMTPEQHRASQRSGAEKA